jgi:hypothetical protein
MRLLTPIRTGILIAAACPALAQIPPSQPTQISQTQTQTAPSHRPEVTYSAGVLSVTAENSSLNQILRDIARVTGMKITGGVTDERVYGTYGPADTSVVLSALLRGTGSNMLLIFDSRQVPQELILTARGGGQTPPSPMAGRDEREDDMPPSRIPRTSRPANVAIPPAVATPATQFQPLPQAMTAPAPVATAPTTAPADTTTQQPSPTGVSTPEEIYQQLIKLQQAKSAPASGTTPH